jgi:hypothetical protein
MRPPVAGSYAQSIRPGWSVTRRSCPTRLPRGMTLSETTLRIAPRSAVALADHVLLRAARTDPAPAERGATSLVERLRRRLEPGARRA